MEKKIKEDEIKELEDEIDLAVDRLFRDKTRELQDYLSKEPPALRPSPVTAVKTPSSGLEPIERLETQILQLEWEVTEENLLKTEAEVQALRKEFRGTPRLVSVLVFMENALQRMIQHSDSIQAPIIKFLIDSKETLKLLIKEEEGEIKTYQQLAFDGLEARLSMMEARQKAQPEIPSTLPPKGRDERPTTGIFEKVLEMFQHIRASSERMEGVLARMEETVLRLDQGAQKWQREVFPKKSPPVLITVFKASGKLFAVENDKIYKVLRVPQAFYGKYSGAQRIRLRDVEVKMIDLRKIFSITEGGEKEGERILLVKDNGEYKGFRVEQVLKRLSTPLLQKGGETAGYYEGIIQWKYEDHPVEIPVLDLKKF